jgi:hypothetical protein
MALLSGFDELDPGADTFADWVNKTNELILYVRGSTDAGQTSIVTANSQLGGSQTFGNATIWGQVSANAMVVFNNGGASANTLVDGAYGGLRGGTWDGAANAIASDTLYVVSNTTFTNESTEVYVNSTYGLIVENDTELRLDVHFVGNSGSNTDAQLTWQHDENILNFNDDVKGTWGSGDDLEIYYTGTRGNVNTDILDVRGSTNTNIFADVLEVKASNGEFYMTANINNGVELYWDNTKKVSTNTHGVEVYGQVLADNGFVTYNNQPIEMGGANYAAAHNFTIVTDGTDTTITETSNDLSVRVEDNFRVTDDTGTTSLIVANTAGEVTLYHNNNQKMQTNAYGVEITGEANTGTLRVRGDTAFDGSGGLDSDTLYWESSNNTLNWNDDAKATFGNDDDFQIYHDSGNNSTYVIEEGTGDLHIQANNMQIEDTSGQAYFCGTAGLGASVHYNGDQKLITTDIGLDITGEANTDTLRVQSTTLLEADVYFDGTANDQMHWDSSLDALHLKDTVDLYFGDGKDFHIFHDGSNTYLIEMGSGELHIQANNMNIEDTSGQTYFCGTAGAGSSVHYNGDQKLITRADGVEANGIMESDTLLVTSTANFEGDVYIDGSTSNNELHWHASSNTLHLKDNVTLSLGNHNTFEMYHEGANTYIKENGSGDLVLQANNIQIEDTAGQAYFCGIAGAGGSIHYNGDQKLITTNIGVDITGLVLGDSLQIDGNVDLGSSNADTVSILGEFDTSLIPAIATANVGAEDSPWDWAYFNDINVANTATILQLEVTTLEANGVAFTGTGEDVTTTSTTEIDAFEYTQTQGFKFFVHGENLSNANSGYAVEINVIVTDNKDIFYTRYGEVENDMSDVVIVPALAANTTHVVLNATCGSASGTDIHRFKVLKIETRAS